MNGEKLNKTLSKVPQVTLIFWVIKIIATTLGETGGDAFSMSLNLGYFVSSIIFSLIFLIAVTSQIKIRTFSPFVYWSTIIATTTLGTTLADYADRSIGIGYSGGTILLLLLLISSIYIWYRTMGSVSVHNLSTPKAEIFYWVTIMFSQTLGTALGDWSADTAGLGYLGAAFIFSGLIFILIILHLFSRTSKTILFWLAFVLTRPLGAVLGDFLDKPITQGGLDLSRYSASVVLICLIIFCILIIPQRAANKSH